MRILVHVVPPDLRLVFNVDPCIDDSIKALSARLGLALGLTLNRLELDGFLLLPSGVPATLLRDNDRITAVVSRKRSHSHASLSDVSDTPLDDTKAATVSKTSIVDVVQSESKSLDSKSLSSSDDSSSEASSSDSEEADSSSSSASSSEDSSDESPEELPATTKVSHARLDTIKPRVQRISTAVAELETESTLQSMSLQERITAYVARKRQSAKDAPALPAVPGVSHTAKDAPALPVAPGVSHPDPKGPQSRPTTPAELVSKKSPAIETPDTTGPEISIITTHLSDRDIKAPQPKRKRKRNRKRKGPQVEEENTKVSNDKDIILNGSTLPKIGQHIGFSKLVITQDCTPEERWMEGIIENIQGTCLTVRLDDAYIKHVDMESDDIENFDGRYEHFEKKPQGMEKFAMDDTDTGLLELEIEECRVIKLTQ
ncbi:MAG: hypothetical protein SGCHY_000791 [Lobulomycetales sp.]